MPDENTNEQEPSLTLIRGDSIDAATICRLFVKLTGREPTAEEMEEARKVLVRDGDRPESEAGY